MPGRDPLDPARSGVKLTYDDFMLFPEDGKRHELSDGEHYVAPSPNRRHQRISRRSTHHLMSSSRTPATRKRDETIKRRLYERFGVTEYCVVDPDIGVVRVYRRTRGGFARAVELSRESHDVLATALLPGLDLPLARIFRE